MWADNSILGILEKSKGYEAALFTTYNFELPFFERQILPILSKNETKAINLFVDAKELNQALADVSSVSMGRDYYVTPIVLNGTFHPKVILLLGENKAKLIVSSANIKSSGYLSNNEVFNSFDYSNDYTDFADLFISSIEFFKKLTILGKCNDDDIKKRLNSFVVKRSDAAIKVHAVHNIDKTIIEQLSNMINEHVEGINIAVPFYDPILEGFAKLKSTFGCKEVKLFIQNEKNTFPIEYNDKYHIINDDQISLFDTVNDKKESKGFYHGKVMEFNTNEKSYILYGSANCSSAALLRTGVEGGNIEFDVLVEGELRSNDPFFKKFVNSKKLPFKNGFVNNAVNESGSNYIYAGGEMDASNNLIILHFSCNKIKDSNIKIEYRNKEINYEINGIEITAKLPLELYEERDNLFDVTIKSGDFEDTIRCWFNDVGRINNFRYSSKVIEIPDVTEDMDFSEYQKYVEMISQALFDNDFYKILKQGNSKGKRTVTNPDDQDVDEINEGLVLKEDIESSYVEKRYVDSIRRSISSSSERYHGLIVGKRNTDEDKKTKEKSKHYPKPARKRTQVSAAGRWLGKQYKKGIDLLLNPENLKTRSYDDYKNVFHTIFDTIQTIFYNQKKDGFLNHEYIIDIKLKYADFMLDKAKDDPIFADMDFLTSFVLLSIIEKEKYYPSENGDERVNRLLYKLNKLSNVRESFMDYVDEINLQSILYEDVPDDIEDDKLKMYLDQKSIEFNQFGYNKLDTLFGYKTKEQMELFFKSRYGDNAEFIVGNNDIEVFAMMDTLNFKKAYTLADNDVKTINKFISGYRLPIKRILFTFRNIDDLSRIVFKMKTDGRIAYQVERTLETKDKSTTLPCKKGENSKTWVLDFERIYK